MSYVVRTTTDIEPLLTPESIVHPFRKPRLSLQIPQMALSEVTAWESCFEALRQQCGCSAGAIALGVFVLCFAAFSVRNSSPASGQMSVRALVLYAALFVVGTTMSALLGKFVGLTVTLIRYRRACFELQKRLRDL